MFLGGKQLYELDPGNKKYLFIQKHSNIIGDELKIRENTVLVSRSGTIGKINIAPKHWNEWVLNEHIIRIVPSCREIAGYIFAWLSSEYGYQLITRFTYGAVVDEIDDKQVSKISIPLLKNKNVQNEINDKVLEANTKRTQAYELEQKAY